jgi:lysophospholipase L1-like esterase
MQNRTARAFLGLSTLGIRPNAPARRPVRHIIFIVSLILNLAFLTLLVWRLYENGWYVSARKLAGNTSAAARTNVVGLFHLSDTLPVVEPRVVMFGDSLTSGGLWSEWFGERVWNRGIGGDTSAQALQRIDEIIELRPTVTIVEFGTNDIGNLPADRTIHNISEMVARLRSSLPGSKVVVLGLLPGPNRERSAVARELNARLASTLGSDTFLDMSKQFATPTGVIVPALTTDGTHLTPEGYTRWCAVFDSTFHGQLLPYSRFHLLAAGASSPLHSSQQNR